MAQPEFSKVSAALDTIFNKPDFQDALKAFVSKNAPTFQDMTSDENKHVFYDVYKQFVAMVDDLLTARLKEVLGPTFDLTKFTETLAKKMEDPSTKEFLSAYVFELLVHVTDFTSFKEMMINACKEQSVEVQKLLEKSAPALNPQQEDVLKSIKDATKVLDAGGAAEGWKVVSKGPEYEVARKKDPTGYPVDIWRIRMNSAVPIEGYMKLFRDPAQRPQWDDDCQSCEIVKGNVGDDDIIMRLVMKGKLMMPPREIYARRVLARDFPEKGAVSVLLAPHDPGTPVPAGMSRGNVRILNSVLRPADTPGRTLDTTFAQFDMGMVPGFISNMMMGHLMPRLPAKIEAGYHKIMKLK
eukprot:RCo045939